MSFSAKEAPEEMIGKRTPFSTAKSFASYCRSSAFDQSDGPMLALKFEELASALAAAYLDATVAPASDPAPVGWRMVPVEPTIEMINQIVGSINFRSRELATQLYARIVAAAPEPPVSDGWGTLDHMHNEWAHLTPPRPKGGNKMTEKNQLLDDFWKADVVHVSAVQLEEIRADAYRAGRLAQAEEDAGIALAQKGKAADIRHNRGPKLSGYYAEDQAEILAEERGEDIAAEIIAAAIRANAAKIGEGGE